MKSGSVAEEEKDKSIDNNEKASDITVSRDCTWQKEATPLFMVLWQLLPVTQESLIDVFNLIKIESGSFCERYCIQRDKAMLIK